MQHVLVYYLMNIISRTKHLLGKFKTKIGAFTTFQVTPYSNTIHTILKFAVKPCTDLKFILKTSVSFHLANISVRMS